MITSTFMATAGHQQTPYLVWNASPSVPTGLYRLLWHPVTRGDLAIIRLPTTIASLAASRGYVPERVYLLKPVAAIAGDLVCRVGWRVTVNGGTVAHARPFDGRGRAMRRWQGCRRLNGDQIFVLATLPASFDGRYFGPLSLVTVLGRAEPIWTKKL